MDKQFENRMMEYDGVIFKKIDNPPEKSDILDKLMKISEVVKE
jgi:hypothetical protein